MSGYETDPAWIAAREEATRPAGDTAAERFANGTRATYRMYEIEQAHAVDQLWATSP